MSKLNQDSSILCGVFRDKSLLGSTESLPNERFDPYRPLAEYGLPPSRGNFVDHIFLEAQCLAMILQHVNPLTIL